MYPRHNLQITKDQCVLLIIDPQNDFHDGGTLAVPGATEQAKRIAKMIRDHKDDIGEIFITLDSHHKRHIAHKAFWSDQENDLNYSGNEPEDFTVITEKDLQDGKWFPKDCSLQSYCMKYARKLEAGGKFKLTIWPDHCLIGSDGHAIQDDIQNAVREWDIHNYTKTVKHIHKGMNCLTEMYSAIEAEVPIPSDTSTTQNTELLNALAESKRLIVCGQALSHCVNFTVRDIVKHWQSPSVEKSLAELYILEDGSAPVKTYEEKGQEFINDMKKLNVTVTTIDKAFVGWVNKPKEPVENLNAKFGNADGDMRLQDVADRSM